jgi:hypothetical protein
LKDLQCHNLDPATDVDNVALLRFPNAMPADVEGMLGATTLDTNDLASYHDVAVGTVDPMAPCVQTGSMDSFGEVIVPAEDYVLTPTDTYMLVLTRGTTPGFGAITMVFLQPTMGNTDTMVMVPPGCPPAGMPGLLSFSANLTMLTPVSIPAAGPWVVDWSKVTRDGGGGDITAADIDRVLIGFYEGKAIADLEMNIFDLEYDDPMMDYYTKVWEAPIDRQKSADLALAVERGTSTPFPGFTQANGIYVLGLMCGSCQNPAPIILTVLQPV